MNSSCTSNQRRWYAISSRLAYRFLVLLVLAFFSSVLGARDAADNRIILPDSALAWSLVGVFAHSDAHRSAAILRNEDKRQLFVRPQTSIEENVRIHVIDSSGVVINNRGRYERLYLKRSRRPPQAPDEPLPNATVPAIQAGKKDNNVSSLHTNLNGLSRKDRIVEYKKSIKLYFEHKQTSDRET